MTRRKNPVVLQDDIYGTVWIHKHRPAVCDQSRMLKGFAIVSEFMGETILLGEGDKRAGINYVMEHAHEYFTNEDLQAGISVINAATFNKIRSQERA